MTEGLQREPTASEIMFFSAAHHIKECLDNHASILRETKTDFAIQNFRIGAEYHQIPVFMGLFDIVITTNISEIDSTLSDAKKAENLLRQLAIYCTRLQILNKSNITPLHKVMTQIFSNYHRRELMTFTHKIGSSLPYVYDLEQNKEAKKKFEEACTDFFNKIDSTIHFWNLDNLETMRKWGSMMKHGEKVINFMTAMLDYVDNCHQTLDFYRQEDEHLQDISSLKYSSNDIEKRDKLGESVSNYCKQLEDSLPSETDEYLSSLPNPPLNQK